MFELLMKNESDWIDITQLVGGLEWAENLDNIGMTISFSVPCDDSQKYLQNIDLRAGRNVKLVSDGEEIKSFSCHKCRYKPVQKKCFRHRI